MELRRQLRLCGVGAVSMELPGVAEVEEYQRAGGGGEAEEWGL